MKPGAEKNSDNSDLFGVYDVSLNCNSRCLSVCNLSMMIYCIQHSSSVVCLSRVQLFSFCLIFTFVSFTFPLHVTPGVTEWTSWFNIDHPGGNGDYERLEAIRFYYRERVCTRPMAMEARTTDWVEAADTGEVVHSSLEKGFWCINREQPHGRVCSNYHVRFQCPSGSSVDNLS